ncbi:hypothetical protein AVEN_50409-1 [Araneus ventricosus]|uniref:Uncharacterized protein n=1 Tax=Araneus ventricosus TaxID=182803 RepID=A0A4Y2U0T5_ARAVE|nr:hypothetical protein AVEN_50409-1 [Araneus ventricosus]
MSNLEQMIPNSGIQKNLNSKTQSADSNLRPRCESSGKAKDLPTLAPRTEGRNETRNPQVGEEESGWQEFCDFEPCLKTNFGTSVNALPNFSTKMGEGKTSLRTNGTASLLVNTQLKKRKMAAVVTFYTAEKMGKSRRSRDFVSYNRNAFI